jgi:hypothetical protein
LVASQGCAGFDRGGERAADVYSLIVTPKLNDVDPRTWLAHALRIIAEQPAHRLDEPSHGTGGSQLASQTPQPEIVRGARRMDASVLVSTGQL